MSFIPSGFISLGLPIGGGVSSPPIPATVVASRTQVVAPATVFFELEGVSEDDQINFSWEYDYGEDWQFHHVAPGQVPTSKALTSARRSYGPRGAHTYLTPGNYAVSAAKRSRQDDAENDYPILEDILSGGTIEVLDPDVAISAANTKIVISAGGVDTSAAAAQIARGVEVMVWANERAAIEAFLAQPNVRGYTIPGDELPLPNNALDLGLGTYFGRVDYWNTGGTKTRLTILERTATETFDIIDFSAGSVVCGVDIDGGWDIATNNFSVPGKPRLGRPSDGGAFLGSRLVNFESLGDVLDDASYVDCDFGNHSSYGVFVGVQNHRFAFLGNAWPVDHSAAPVAGGSDWGWFGHMRTGNVRTAILISNWWSRVRRPDSDQEMVRGNSFTETLTVAPNWIISGNHFPNDTIQIGPQADQSIADPSGNFGTITVEKNHLNTFETEYAGFRIADNVLGVGGTRQPIRLLREDFAAGRPNLYAGAYATRPCVRDGNTVITPREPPGSYSTGSQGAHIWWRVGGENLDIRPAQQGLTDRGNAFAFDPVYARDSKSIHDGVSMTDGRPFADRNSLLLSRDGPPTVSDVTGALRTAPFRRGAYNQPGDETSDLPLDPTDADLLAALGSSGVRHAWPMPVGDTPTGLFQDTDGLVPVTTSGQFVGRIRDINSGLADIVLQQTPDARVTAQQLEDSTWCVQFEQAAGSVANLRATLPTPIEVQTTSLITFVHMFEGTDDEAGNRMVRLMTGGGGQAFRVSVNDWVRAEWSGTGGAQFDMGQNTVAGRPTKQMITTWGDGTRAYAERAGPYGESREIPREGSDDGFGTGNVARLDLDPFAIAGTYRFFGAAISSNDIGASGRQTVRDNLRARVAAREPGYVPPVAILPLGDYPGVFSWHSLRDAGSLNVSGGGLVLNVQDQAARAGRRLLGTPGGTPFRPKPVANGVLIDQNAGFNFEAELPENYDIFMIVAGTTHTGGTKNLVAVDGAGSDSLVQLRINGSGRLHDPTRGTADFGSVIPTSGAFLFTYRRSGGAAFGGVNGETLVQGVASGVPKADRIGNRGDQFGHWNEIFHDVAVYDLDDPSYDAAAVTLSALAVVADLNGT